MNLILALLYKAVSVACGNGPLKPGCSIYLQELKLALCDKNLLFYLMGPYIFIWDLCGSPSSPDSISETFPFCCLGCVGKLRDHTSTYKISCQLLKKQQNNSYLTFLGQYGRNLILNSWIVKIYVIMKTLGYSMQVAFVVFTLSTLSWKEAHLV